MKYQKGDKVMLARPSALRGRYGIGQSYFGKQYVVNNVYDHDDNDRSGYVIMGHDMVFAVFHDMLDPVGGPW